MQAIVTGVPGYDRFLYELTVARILRSDVRWTVRHYGAILGHNSHHIHCPGSIVEATIGSQVGAHRRNLTDWSRRNRIGSALNAVIGASDNRGDGHDQHHAILRQGILRALNITPLLTAGVSHETV